MKNLSKFFLAALFALAFFGPIHLATQTQPTTQTDFPSDPLPEESF